MSDNFGIDTGQMKTIAGNILTDNGNLEKQTNTFLDQLDEVYLRFPPGVASLAQMSQISMTAGFKRVRTENARIGVTLQAIAAAIEDEEKKLVQAFTPPSPHK